MHGGQSNVCPGRYQNPWKSTSQPLSPKYNLLAGGKITYIGYGSSQINPRRRQPIYMTALLCPKRTELHWPINPRTAPAMFFRVAEETVVNQKRIAIFITSSYSSTGRSGRRTSTKPAGWERG